MPISNIAKVVRHWKFVRGSTLKRNLQAVLAMICAVFGIGSCLGDQDLDFLYRPSGLVGSRPIQASDCDAFESLFPL